MYEAIENQTSFDLNDIIRKTSKNERFYIELSKKLLEIGCFGSKLIIKSMKQGYYGPKTGCMFEK